MTFAFYVISLTAVILMLGCEDPTKNDYRFSNQSSYRVDVSPNGQTGWTPFFLDPGTSLHIKIDEDHIYYRYSPSDKVFADNRGDDIVFLNR